ncbi:MAG: geranylgeranylglycerol-phosphate geranylgeranyltransferase [Bacteroidales bacterium]|nr:geranylgeranylglycerol-phosphate geranylgeranyltransferase [Bacteroidales bacterium]
MKKLGSFFKLVRWPNLIITALMMCLVYHNLVGMDSTIGFTLLVISMVLIQAGGYVINDIFDKEIDEINKPDKLIVGKIFTEKQCNFFYWTLTVIGLACALVATLLMNGSKFITVFGCMVLLACILYSYSKTYKKSLVFGNLIVSSSVAFAVFVPWLFVMLYLAKENLLADNYNVMMQISLHLAMAYTVFAFLMTLIREIVKDMQDVKGDGRQHCRTIPIIWGMTAAQIIVIVLSFVTCVMIWNAADYFNGLGCNITHYMLYASGLLVFFVIVNNFTSLVTEKSMRTEKQFRLQSMFLKISMLIGVLSMFFIK